MESWFSDKIFGRIKCEHHRTLNVEVKKGTEVHFFTSMFDVGRSMFDVRCSMFAFNSHVGLRATPALRGTSDTGLARNNMDDITATLRQRLLILLEQVKRDRASLTLPEHAEGDRVYARLFDSLTVTLHNLDCSWLDSSSLDCSAEVARFGGET